MMPKQQPNVTVIMAGCLIGRDAGVGIVGKVGDV